MSFCSLSQLKNYLGENFVSNDPGDSTLLDNLLQQKLDDEADEIVNEWNYGIENIPFTASDPPTWLDLLLQLLNLEPVITSILLDRALVKGDLFKKQKELYEQLANYRKQDFVLGRLNSAILYFLDGNEIETTPFVIDNQKFARDTPGLTITDISNPNNDTATMIATLESCYVRAKAMSPENYVVTINNLNTRQLNKYKEFTVDLVSPQIQRIHLSCNYNNQIGDVINFNLDGALKNLNDLSVGKYKKIFL